MTAVAQVEVSAGVALPASTHYRVHLAAVTNNIVAAHMTRTRTRKQSPNMPPLHAATSPHQYTQLLLDHAHTLARVSRNR